MADSESEDEAAVSKYRAPALEKGLDVLELLVTERRPLTMSEICSRLGRSQGEIFRMVQVLQGRDFLEQDSETDGYVLTERLFQMAMRQPRMQNLTELALPIMRSLTAEIGQSCHIAVHARGETVVIVRMESDEQIGYSVRLGYRNTILRTGSGELLFAFQPNDIRERWLGYLPAATERAEIDDFVARADQARLRGYTRKVSTFVPGITDLSAPIMRGARAAAALSVPFLQHAEVRHSLNEAIEKLVAAAATLSGQLVDADNRV